MFSVGEGEAILISRGSNVIMVDGGSAPRKPTNDAIRLSLLCEPIRNGTRPHCNRLLESSQPTCAKAGLMAKLSPNS